MLNVMIDDVLMIKIIIMKELRKAIETIKHIRWKGFNIIRVEVQ